MGKFCAVRDDRMVAVLLTSLAERYRSMHLWKRPVSSPGGDGLVSLDEETGVVEWRPVGMSLVGYEKVGWWRFVGLVELCWKKKLLDEARNLDLGRIRASMDDAWYERPWTSLVYVRCDRDVMGQVHRLNSYYNLGMLLSFAPATVMLNFLRLDVTTGIVSLVNSVPAGGREVEPSVFLCWAEDCWRRLKFPGGDGPLPPLITIDWKKLSTPSWTLDTRPRGDQEMNDFNRNLQQFWAKRFDDILKHREQIVEAFVAKYGCGPDEVELVEQRGEKEWTFYVKKKEKTVRVYNNMHVIGKIAEKAGFTLIADRSGPSVKVDIKGCCSLGVPKLYHDHKLDICLPEEFNDQGRHGRCGEYVYYVPREVFKELLEGGGEQDESVIMSRVLTSDIYRMKP